MTAFGFRSCRRRPLRTRRLCGFILGLTFVIALAPTGAQAATQTRSDPSDAPGGAFGKADVRSIAWDVSGVSAQLTVGIEESSYVGGRAEIGVHVLIDSNGDALADHEIVATRNADGTSVDVAVRRLDGTLSTSDCQDLAGVVAAAATVNSTISDGFEIFKFSFDPAQVPGDLAAFDWAVFAQAPSDGAGAGPWDFMPDAANPDPAAANPGDRRCDSAKSGLSLRMSEGYTFPDEPEPPPVVLPPADTEAPQTSIDTKKVSHGRRNAKFTFSSSESDSTFECRLDRKPFESCASPRTYRRLKRGKHKLRVRATDQAGNADPTPAVANFKIRR